MPIPLPDNTSPDAPQKIEAPSFDDPGVQQHYVQKLLEKKSKHGEEVVEGDAEATLQVIQGMRGKYESAVAEKGLIFREDGIFKNLADSLDEASANFNSVFPDHKISWHEFLQQLQHNPNLIEVKAVQPLDYFTDVGNGMTPDKERQSIEKAKEHLQTQAPELAEGLLSDDQTRAVQTALGIVNNPDYVYTMLDKKQVERDRQKGYDHIAVTRFHLEQLAKGYALPPAVVAKFTPSSERYEPETTKTVLDGTHRAVAAVWANRELFVIELNMDALAAKKSA